ncbi:MAG: type II toxin-antitoxin system VapC family toxin [Deltaproteobacteria bacterium]|nr:type II toxin-antitoxin system VapC family toxin [Deltaproteobacteria bacterium]
MGAVLVDSNVLLDVLTEDKTWFDWSSRTLSKHAEKSILTINPIIYAEVSVGFDRIEELDEALPEKLIKRLPLPWEAAFLAGKCFVQYRRRGGAKHAPLPDFYIGAHAAINGLKLLTRDATRYKTYFPKLRVVSPKVH